MGGPRFSTCTAGEQTYMLPTAQAEVNRHIGGDRRSELTQVSAILARTSSATAARPATRAVSWGHQASDTEHGVRSRIGTKVTPGRLYQRPTASDVMLRPTPRETRWVSASSVLASATTGAGPYR